MILNYPSLLFPILSSVQFIYLASFMFNKAVVSYTFPFIFGMCVTFSRPGFPGQIGEICASQRHLVGAIGAVLVVEGIPW